MILRAALRSVYTQTRTCPATRPRCAVTSFPRRRVLASAETLQGRQCQFPLYEASEIPLALHRALQPFPLAGASHAWPTKRLEAQQVCFSARRSWIRWSVLLQCRAMTARARSRSRFPYRTFACAQSSTSRAMSRLFFSIMTMWPLPRMPLSCRRMYSVFTPAWLRYFAVQWS